MEQLPSDIRWHMIGHLQRNKVKYIVGKVELIHSVDTYRLAEEINIQAKKQNVIVPILVEVNIAHEESKFGISAEDAILLVEEISKLENIRIKGLMTIAPYVENPEDNRLYFRKIKQLSVDITNKNIDNVFMEILSMGMTGDYMAVSYTHLDVYKRQSWRSVPDYYGEKDLTIRIRLRSKTETLFWNLKMTLFSRLQVKNLDLWAVQ